MECGELCPYNTPYTILCNGIKVPNLSKAQADGIEIIGVLGEGSTGKAYLAILNGHFITVKYVILSEQYVGFYGIGSTRFEERLNLEVCMQYQAAQIGIAPRILGVWRCDDSDEDILEKDIIVMEFINGSSLPEYIKSNPTELINIYMDVIYKIVELNQVAGIIHCDLHSENIMLNRGKIIIIDYGEADNYPPLADLENSIKINNLKEVSYRYFEDMCRFTASFNIIMKSDKRNARFLHMRQIINTHHLKRQEGWMTLYVLFYKKNRKLPSPSNVRDILRTKLI